MMSASARAHMHVRCENIFLIAHLLPSISGSLLSLKLVLPEVVLAEAQFLCSIYMDWGFYVKIVQSISPDTDVAVTYVISLWIGCLTVSAAVQDLRSSVNWSAAFFLYKHILIWRLKMIELTGPSTIIKVSSRPGCSMTQLANVCLTIVSFLFSLDGWLFLQASFVQLQWYPDHPAMCVKTKGQQSKIVFSETPACASATC